MKRILMLAGLMSLMLLAGNGYATTYNSNIQKVTDFNPSSGTIQGYTVAAATIVVVMDSSDRVVVILNTGSTTVWFGYTQTISTWAITSVNNTTFPLKVDQAIQPTSRKPLYFLNDNLGATGGQIRTWKEKDK